MGRYLRKEELMTRMRKKPATAELKFKVALEAIKGEKTSAQLAQEFGVASSQIFKWKRELLEHGPGVFGKKGHDGNGQETIDQLHAVIGKLKVENDFLERVLGRK